LDIFERKGGKGWIYRKAYAIDFRLLDVGDQGRYAWMGSWTYYGNGNAAGES
jgi:hypothetical protein